MTPFIVAVKRGELWG